MRQEQELGAAPLVCPTLIDQEAQPCCEGGDRGHRAERCHRIHFLGAPGTINWVILRLWLTTQYK